MNYITHDPLDMNLGFMLLHIINDNQLTYGQNIKSYLNKLFKI
jgi:hypothetical protein